MVGHRAGSRPGGAGQGVPDAARTPGPCVFRPEHVSLAGSMCLWPEACVLGRKHVSLARKHVPTGGPCAFRHVSSRRGMCQRACANGPQHVSLGCKCSISSLLRDAGPLPVRAPAGPGGASRDAAGATGPCVFRPGPVFFDRALCFSTGPCVFRPNPVFFGRSLCLGPVFFGAETGVSGGEQVSTGRCQRAGACVFGRCHDAGAGVNGMCQTGGAFVLGMCHGAGACANGPKHVSLGCRCSIPSTLRDAGPLPVRAPPGPGGASRDAAGASGPCVFRSDPVVNRQRKCPTFKQRKCPTPEAGGAGGRKGDLGEFSPRSGGASGGAGSAPAASPESGGGPPGRAGRAAFEGGPEGRLRKPPAPPARRAPGPGKAPEPPRQVEGQTDPLHSPASSASFAGSGRGRNTLVRSVRCRSR